MSILPDNLKTLLIDEYNFTEIISYSPFTDGTFGAAYIETPQGKFALKRCEDKTVLELYDIVQRRLNRENICQPKIICTNQGSLISESGYALYEFIEGDWDYSPSTQELVSFVEYVAKYNTILSEISPPAWLNEIRNNFDRARSWHYLSSEFFPHLSKVDLPKDVFTVIEKTITRLSVTAPGLGALNSQLVHVDPSPGNILYRGGAAITLLDFTPAVEPHLYSMCVFLCSHFVLFNRSNDTPANLLRMFERYKRSRRIEHIDYDLFFSTLLRAQAAGAFIPLIFVTRDEAMPWNGISTFDPMAIDALKYVLELDSTKQFRA